MLGVLIAIALVFGLLRFTLPVEGKIDKRDINDLAHVFVGFLFGYAAADGDWKFWALAIGLTVLEVAAFLIRKSPTERK